MRVKSHHLKIDEQFVDEIFSSENKRVEIRLNDRDYQRGDVISFETKWGKLHVQILHVLSGWGLQPNYVALSIKTITEKTYQKILNTP